MRDKLLDDEGQKAYEQLRAEHKQIFDKAASESAHEDK